MLTVFPLISAPSAIKFWNCDERRLLGGGAYFNVREMNNITCQNFVIFFFQIKYET